MRRVRVPRQESPAWKAGLLARLFGLQSGRGGVEQRLMGTGTGHQ